MMTLEKFAQKENDIINIMIIMKYLNMNVHNGYRANYVPDLN